MTGVLPLSLPPIASACCWNEQSGGAQREAVFTLRTVPPSPLLLPPLTGTLVPLGRVELSPCEPSQDVVGPAAQGGSRQSTVPSPVVREGRKPLSCWGTAEGPWPSCPGICGHDAEAGGLGLERFCKLWMCKSPREVGDALLLGLRAFASHRELCAEPGGLVVNESPQPRGGRGSVFGGPSRKASVLLSGLTLGTDKNRKPQKWGFAPCFPLCQGHRGPRYRQTRDFPGAAPGLALSFTRVGGSAAGHGQP